MLQLIFVMIRRYIPRNKKELTAFLAGMAFIVVIGSLVFGVRLLSEKKKPNIVRQTIAPYYEQEEFKLPQEIVNRATASATTVPIMKIPIIMYHYVEYVKDINDLVRKKLNINPYLFEGQMKSLEEAGFKTYFVKDVPDILNGKIGLSSKSAILTFDDGYEDFYTVVFPILKKYQLRATAYIIYDFIGRKGFMNEKEINEILASDLVEIGSHTLDHLYLKLVPESTARKQIFESKQKLEERFRIKIMTFAYPYGAFTQETVNLVKEAGYIAAVTVIPGMQQSEQNLFYLSRVRPGIFTPQTIVQVIENYKK